MRKRTLASRANFKMEFNMLALTKPASIAMAVTLGIALGMPLSIPAFSDPAPSSATIQSPATAPALHSGDLVRVRSGGPLMTVTGVQGDEVNCSWTDWDGQLISQNFPTAVLSVPVTVPPEDPNLDKDIQATDRYYRAHCPPGSLSVTGKYVCAF
jgi:uncharacterized protein YodC (DUF2158 family)